MRINKGRGLLAQSFFLSWHVDGRYGYSVEKCQLKGYNNSASYTAGGMRCSKHNGS